MSNTGEGALQRRQWIGHLLQEAFAAFGQARRRVLR
jgi:hypothetical protein